MESTPTATKVAKTQAEQVVLDLTKPDVQIEPEKSLGDQIAELETLTKAVKAVKDSDRGKILLEGWRRTSGSSSSGSSKNVPGRGPPA